jgi:hypothetical protein
VFASYDSLSISPESSTGLNSNGSGTIALLELSRIFAKLSKSMQGSFSPNYDLLFVLTPTGSLNFEATTFFIDTLKESIKERIKFSICLDSLASINKSVSIFTGLGEQDENSMDILNVSMS